tara:strand:- start:3600 stop:4691 length:1092 start_codon:yes stop_codon:yes gene_type:complete
MVLSNKTPLVAVDIGSHSVKLAQLKEAKTGFELDSFGLLPLGPDAITEGVVKDPAAVVDAISSLIKAEKIKTRFAVGSVSGEAVTINKIKLPLMSREDLQRIIYKEAEKYIPFEANDVSLDFQILSCPDGGGSNFQTNGKVENELDKMEVLIVAVKKEVIDTRTEILLRAGLKPVLIDLNVFALMNAVGLSAEMDRKGAIILVDLGDSLTHIHLVDGGFSYFTRVFKGVGRKCTKKLQSTFKIPYRDATAIKTGVLPKSADKQRVLDIMVESFNPISNEIASIAEMFEAQNGRKPEKVFLCGGGAIISGIEELFQSNLKIPVEVFDPMRLVLFDREKFDFRCLSEIAPIATVVIGLATRRFDY